MSFQPLLLKAIVRKQYLTGLEKYEQYKDLKSFFTKATIYFKVSNITDFHRLVDRVKREHVNKQETLSQVYWKDNEKSSVVMDPYDPDDFDAVYEYSKRQKCLEKVIYFVISFEKVKPAENHSDLEGKDKLKINNKKY